MDIGTLTGVVAIEDQLTGKLRTLSTTVWKFVDNYGGALATAAFSTAALTTAVAGAVVSIVGLGTKGSTILGVEDAFNRLAVAAGSTGEKMAGALSSGVRGTVDSMELMQATTKLLSSGLKVSEADLKLMAQTAREVGKASGTDAANGLNTLSNAMVTGNARALKRYGIQIDLAAAEREFRKSLGGTTAELSAAGKLEVNRIAVLEGMRNKLNALGESELSFKERVQQVSVSLGNWVDDLAKAVAASPNVLRAFDSIAEAVKRAFGVSSQTMLDVVVRWINRFADAVSYWGPIIIRVVANIRDRIIYIWEAVVRAWNLVPDWFKNIAKEAAVAGGALFLTNKLLGQMAGGSDALSLAASWATITSGINDFTKAAITLVPKAVVQIKSLADAVKVLYLLGSFAGGGVMGGIGGVLTGIGAGMAAIAGSATGITVLVTGFAAALWQVFKAVDSLSENWKRGGGTLWGFLTLKNDDNFARRWLGLSTGINETAKAVERLHRGQMQARDVLPVISPGYISGGAAAARERDEAANNAAGYGSQKGLFEDTAAEKVKALTKSWADAAMSSNVFRTAFASLSEEQLKNRDIQQMVLPEIQKLADAHERLTPKMIDVANSVMDTRLAYVEKDKALLASIGLTETQVAEMKKLGMTEVDIATQLGVTTTALQLRLAAMQEAQTRQEALASFENELVNQQAADNARREAVALAANKAIGASYEELNDLINQQTMTSTQYQIQKIKEQEAASIATFSATGASANAIKEYTEIAIELSNRRIAALMVDEDTLRQYSRVTLQEQADKARGTYLAMAKHPELYSTNTIKRFKKIAEEAQRHADGTKDAWETAFKALDYASGIADALPGKFGEIASAAVDAAQNIATGFAEGGLVGGIMAGIEEGIKAVVKLFGETAYEKRTKEEAERMKTLTAEAVKAAGGMERLAFNAHRVGINIQGAFASRDPEFLSEILDEIRDRTEKLNSALQEYGLTWQDMSEEFRGAAIADEFDALQEKMELLQGVGIDYDTILKRQAGSYNDLIQAAIRSGQKMPAAMRPVVEQLIRIGGLTQKTADLMMGLADDGVPSLDDIRDAASRYGITLDQLGGKVKQLEITELAAQYVSDWDILTAATDDWGVIVDKMQPKIQDLVTDAMKYGSTLPANMKPMIQAFIDAGKLVDDNGDKLTDLSQLKWATPLEDMFETLIEKLDLFIDRIADAAGGLAGLGNVPSIAPTENRGNPEYQDPSYYSRGGTVIAFRPRGTDTVPAMLTPGERVIPRGGGGGKVIVEIDKRWLAETLVPEIPGAVKRMGVGR